MRIVCDTNVLIAGIVSDGLCRDIVKRCLPKHELFVSEPLLLELQTKLREKFDIDPARVPLLAFYRERANLVSPSRLPNPVSRDPDDDVVLATALAARANIILTGDKDLLVHDPYEGVRILSPRQFIETLESPPAS